MLTRLVVVFSFAEPTKAAMQQELPSALIFLLVLGMWMAVLNAQILSTFADDQPRRYVSIDGLRGLLAISVFAHHFSLTTQWQRLGLWQLTPDQAWNNMGSTAVTMFFMITGFLFFEKISDPKRRIDFPGFFKGRLLRIYPVYIVCLCLVGLVALSMPDNSATLWSAIKSVVWWLVFCPERLFGMSDAGLAVAYTPWSLRYEWCFYLALPLLAWAWRRLWHHPAFIVGLCVGALILARWPLQFQHSPFSLDTRFIAPFTLGGMVLLMTRDERLSRIAQGPFGSLAAIGALGILCVWGEPYSVKSYAVASVAFVPIAAGASLFGLLKTRPMLILGAISYDVYLLHGLVLFVAFHIIAPTSLASMTPVVFALCLALTGMAVIAISAAAHRLIEVPAMSMSSRLRSADPRERLAAP